MRTIRKLICAALALLLLAAPAMAASVKVVTNAATSVYRTASTDSDAVSVPKGVELNLTAYDSGWGRVSVGGRSGYVKISYLNLKNPVAVYLSKDAALYFSAGSGSAGTLAKGTKVYFLGIDGDYARVTNGSSRTGYVALNALTTKRSAQSLLATEASAKESRIERTIYTAQNLLGRPYKLLAEPPESFNCAAFVYYCYNAAESGSIGKNLYEQVHDDSHRKIDSISSLKRGDLVCFNFSSSSDTYGHVGIYIGDGWFVHASTSANEVTVNKLTSGYYKNSFSWGRRIFND